MRARISDIVTIASRLSGAPEKRIFGEGRRHNICAVRAAVYIIAREHGYTFPEIGQRIGGRDHSTVIHGYNALPRYRHYFGFVDEFVEAVRANALALPPFVSETDWKPERKFRFGTFKGLSKPKKKPVKKKNTRGRETFAEAEQEAEVRLIKRRNDFITEAPACEHGAAQAMVRGSQALLDAIRKAAA